MKYHCSFNFLYRKDVISIYPTFMSVDNISDIINYFRKDHTSIVSLLNEKEYLVEDTSIAMYIYCDVDQETYNDNRFIFKLKNVREYKQYLWLDKDGVGKLLKKKIRIDKLNKLGI